MLNLFIKASNGKVGILVISVENGLWLSVATSVRFFVFKWPDKFMDKNGIFNFLF